MAEQQKKDRFCDNSLLDIVYFQEFKAAERKFDTERTGQVPHRFAGLDNGSY